MSEPRLNISSSQSRLSSPWWGIHEARYRFALKYVCGDKVLDVACGTGYGLPILLSAVKYAVGVDVDAQSLLSASRELNGANCRLVLASGASLPFPDRAFDTVTSFETIEHLEDRSTFVAELARVLTPNGVCIFSTPNAVYTRPLNGKPRNPYHIYEYTPSEFVALLSKYFRSIQTLGQRLRPTFTISPFWDDQQHLHTARDLCRLALWRLLNRLPRIARESLSQAIWGHPFTPSFSDYEFTQSGLESAPVQVAICRSPFM